MRIIAGKFKSRRLAAPPPGIRPTSDKLRETLFNILGPSVQGAAFLDGCAGTGAIGIEAISRGAAMVRFVDQSGKACRIIRRNLQSLGIEGGFEIFEMDIVKALELAGNGFDIAFLDPPYDRNDLYDAALNRFGSSPVLAPGGVLVVEHSKRMELPVVSGTLRKIRSLVQGDAALAFYKP